MGVPVLNSGGCTGTATVTRRPFATWLQQVEVLRETVAMVGLHRCCLLAARAGAAVETTGAANECFLFHGLQHGYVDRYEHML